MSDVSGTYVWADRKRNVTIVLLANGAYPAIPTLNPAIFQGKLSDAIMTALGYWFVRFSTNISYDHTKYTYIID